MTNDRRDPSPRFSYLIGRIDRVVRRELIDVLGDADLTLNQYTVLSILAARPGLTNAQLARRSLVTPQAMNQAMNSLIEQGLVERRPHPTNGRKLQVALTATGRARLADVDSVVDDAEDRILQKLTPDERHQLERTLRRVAELETVEDGQP